MTDEQTAYFLLGRIKEVLIANNKVTDIHGLRKLDHHLQIMCDKLESLDKELYNKLMNNKLPFVYYKK